MTSYGKSPFIVVVPIKHADFPQQMVSQYQRVYPINFRETIIFLWFLYGLPSSRQECD